MNKILKSKKWIRITNDPRNYAIELMYNYKNGLITSKIKKIEEQVKAAYSLKEIKITNWLVMRSTARNSYETRYTIITPKENYIFFWLVKLETGQIVPLNTTSEEIIQ